MKGDFSRITFDRSKHYTGVRMQQGRVQLDADWNEQVDIGNYQRHTLAADLIGGSGAPESGGGFEIKADSSGNGLLLTAGRYYVDGILCENEAEIPLTEQPELPGFALPGPEEGGRYLAYLDVWERSITALEDEDILELALGGADTATRTRTVWQVKLAKFAITTSTVPADWQPDPRDLPTLAASALGGSPQENQLYRIEVHEPARPDSAGNLRPTFKWSRDNASSVARIQNPGDNSQENRFQIVIERQVGPDQGGGFETGQWIEVTDEDRILRGEPGILAKLSSVSGQVLSVEGWPDANAEVPDLPNRPTIRRWDSDGASQGERAGDIATLNLDGSVQVKITGASGSFRTGDYWLVTTRAAEGVQGPENEQGAPLAVPPRGIRHHYAPLAFVDLIGNIWSRVNSPESVRKVFKGTTAVPGGEKLNRKENDTMTASLVIEGSLTVGLASPPSTPSKGLALVDGPLVLAQGATPDYGLRFANSGSFLSADDARMVLGVPGGRSLALSQGGDERLTLASDGRVGIRVASPEQDVHVRGGVILLEPDTRVEIKRALAYNHGSRGEGKVLTSDKDGNATWRELPTRQVGAPVFVHRFEVARSPSITFPNAAASTNWIRFQLPDVMPTGIRAVILEAQAAKKDPNSGVIDGYIAIRRTLGASQDILLRARAAGGGDVNAWSNQGLFPVHTDNSFEYAIEGSGFDDGWILRVIGYFP